MEITHKSSKNFLLIMMLMFLVGAFTLFARTADSPQPPAILPKSDESIEESINAIYLCTGNGILSSEDLQNFPEVAVVHTLGDLKKLSAPRKLALWIDKNAVTLVEEEWLHLEPQKYYPLVLVGYNDAAYAFGEVFTDFGVERPNTHQIRQLSPGFSVWCLKESQDPSSPSFMYGYSIKPTVDGILKVTNALLYGSILDRTLGD